MNVKLLYFLGAEVMSASDAGSGNGNVMVSKDMDPSTRDLFLPFRCFCTRKDVRFPLLFYVK